MPKGKIKIVEVGPRDGLQNESRQLSVALRSQLVEKLAATGERFIEVGSFVSPKWVPQMADTDKILKRLYKKQSAGHLSKSLDISVLVPNVRGMELAINARAKHVAIFGACSESFSKKNINCSIDESFNRFKTILQMARPHKIKVRGYLSTAFGCPYEGAVSEVKVVQLVEQMLDLGVYEISIGDTIGVATPYQVERLLKRLDRKVGLKKVAMHFHDTRGTALANVLKSLDMGVRTFDASIGGLGGCPYADGASGNLSTEDLIYMLHGMGYTTGVNLSELVAVSRWMSSKMHKLLPSKMTRAGSVPDYI